MSFLEELEESQVSRKDRTILVGVALDHPTHSIGETSKSFLELWDIQENLNELEQLVNTLGGEVVDRMIQKRSTIHPGTYVGSGKVEEIKKLADEKNATSIIFDDNLTPTQVQNLEKVIQRKIMDRAGLILDIFSRNAKTREAKTQVEIAKLKYILPRLAGMWSHLEAEKQRGSGSGMMGMGEKQIESDKRMIKSRIQQLEKKLLQIRKEREVQRSKREEILKVALVGYTNAGKSTLLNLLTDSDVQAEDKLFATLDSSVRTLTPTSRPKILLIDTVGFIKKLPPDLVASFRSTLEEVQEADMILHVVDVSHPKVKEQIKTTEKVLEELGCQEKPGFLVLNKSDQLDEPFMARITAKSYEEVYENTVITSSDRKESIVQLRDRILNFFYDQLESWEIMIPYDEPEVSAKIHEFCHIEKKTFFEKGTFFKLKTTRHFSGLLHLDKYRLDSSEFEKEQEDEFS